MLVLTYLQLKPTFEFSQRHSNRSKYLYNNNNNNNNIDYYY